MCLIMVCIDRKPTYKEIRKAHDENSDGCSISWFNKNGKAEYIKGLSENEVFKLVYETELPFVLHFRKSSFFNDRNNKFLNHPFEITKESELKLKGEADKLLIHNGTIKEYELMLAVANIQPGKEDFMTDTRAIAMIMARDNEKLPWRLPGCFVIVDSNKQQFRIAGNFTTEDGILFSNMKWKDKHYYQGYNYIKGKFFGENINDDDIYKYLNEGDCGANPNCQENDCGAEEDAQKKTFSPTSDEKTQSVKEGKKETKKASKKTKGIQYIKINKEMSELQYNSGIHYVPRKSKRGETIILTPEEEYMREGMKERRKWWRFFYPKHVIAEKSRFPLTEYKCMRCGAFLPNFRVNTLKVMGKSPFEFNCLICDIEVNKVASPSDRMRIDLTQLHKQQTKTLPLNT